MKVATGTKFTHFSILRIHFFLTYQFQIQTEQLKSVSKYGYSVGLNDEYASFVKPHHFKV
jgi:hypothetical protein